MNKIILSALTVLMLVGCTKEDNFDAPSDNILHLTSGNATRAVGDMWEQNDVIGVSMIARPYTGTFVGKQNTQYAATQSGGGSDATFATADFAVVAPDVDLYYPSSGNVDIVAYHPYSVASDDGVYEIDVVNNQADADLVLARKVNVSSSTGALNMEFHHVMSQIEVIMKVGAGLTDTDLAASNITVNLVGSKTKVTYNINGFDANAPTSTAPFGVPDETKDITLAVDDNKVASGIVIPQGIASNSMKLTFEVKGYGTSELVIDTEKFESGKKYIYDVTVDRYSIKFNSTGIESWTEGTTGGNTGTAEEIAFATIAEIGMYYYKDGKFSKDHRAATTANPIVGVIFSVNADGKSGKVVSLDEGSGFAWCAKTALCVTNANNETNGLANMKTIIGRVKGANVPDGATVVAEGVNDFSQTNFPTFWWVHQKNPDGTTYEAGQKGIWYLPSKNELIALYSVYYQYGKNAFNALFNASGVEGSVGFNDDSIYFSSTESDPYNAWHTYFLSGNSNVGTKLSYDANFRTRAILAF